MLEAVKIQGEEAVHAALGEEGLTKAEMRGEKNHAFSCFSKILPCCQINYITFV